MAYLAKSDYSLRIAVNHLDQILEQAATSSGLTADQVLANAEELAKAEIRSYLVSKFKIEDEFGKSGTARNMLVLRYCIDIALYTIHFTVNPRDIPELREKAYKASISDLTAARDANIILGIPQADPFYTRHLLGSNDNKFVSLEFTDPTLFTDCP